MKSWACFVVCLLFTLPAEAFVHGGGPHPPGHGHGGYGLGFWGGVAVPEYPERPDPSDAAAASDFPPPGVIAATLAAATALAAAPDRRMVAPPRPRPGPHIIYIGQRPAPHGPQVIYGTD